MAFSMYEGGNESSEKVVFGSEKIIKSSETIAISSGTGSGTHPHKFLDNPSGKDEHGDSHTTEIKRKTYKNSI